MTSIPQQAARHTRDQSWWWDGSSWRPSSTELPVGRDLALRLRGLAIPVHLIPSFGPLLVLLAPTPILAAAALVAANERYAGSSGLLLIALSVPCLAIPLMLVRLLLGPEANGLRHDISSSTFMRSRGRPEIRPDGESISGWRLRPRIDAAVVRRTLAAMPWAEVDHGAAGAAVFAIRDGDGKSAYELRPSLDRAIRLWCVLGLAVVWVAATSQGALWLANSSRSAATAQVAKDQEQISALAAAAPCPASATTSTHSCFLFYPGVVAALDRVLIGGRRACAAEVQSSSGDDTYNLVADCGIAPPTGSTVTVREWNGKVVDVSYAAQRFDTLDSPDVRYATDAQLRDLADAYIWIWALGPALYLLMVAGGYLAWRRGAPRRHAMYSRSRQHR